MGTKKYLSVFGIFILAVTFSFAQKNKYKIIDANATAETKALYYNLNKLSENYILFGHQHATEYGHGWQGDADRSDVKSVTGSHPAVIGVDFSGLSGRAENNIAKEKAALQKNISDTYNRGGITTVSWHFNNPVSEPNFYWKDSTTAPAVKNIIPGGSHHQKYKAILSTIADLAKSTKGKDGKLVPMIFRPYHEFDGYWFWWGKPYCSVAEFKNLWQFTVTYLRDSLDVHNFIYAFSPDNTFGTEAEFLEIPGAIGKANVVGTTPVTEEVIADTDTTPITSDNVDYTDTGYTDTTTTKKSIAIYWIIGIILVAVIALVFYNKKKKKGNKRKRL